MQNRTSEDRGTQRPASEHSSSSVHWLSSVHSRLAKLPVKNRMHADSSGHVVKSQPLIVQYPSFELGGGSHSRSPLGLQSELMMQLSPISLPQPMVAHTATIHTDLMNARILATGWTAGKAARLP